MGLPKNSQRVAAGVGYALNEASEDGHVFLPTSELVKLTAELLKVSPTLIGVGSARMSNGGEVKVSPSPGAEAIEPPAKLCRRTAPGRPRSRVSCTRYIPWMKPSVCSPRRTLFI